MTPSLRSLLEKVMWLSCTSKRVLAKPHLKRKRCLDSVTSGKASAVFQAETFQRSRAVFTLQTFLPLPSQSLFWEVQKDCLHRAFSKNRQNGSVVLSAASWKEADFFSRFLQRDIWWGETFPKPLTQLCTQTHLGSTSANFLVENQP